MPAAVQRTSSLYRLTKAVNSARHHGGGWVQILIHHVCDVCHRYSIPEGRLRRLLAWLDRRRDVEVLTVSQLLDADGPSVRVHPPPAVSSRATFPVRYRARHGVRRVRYFVDGRQVGVRNIAPWRLKWVPTGISRGPHDVRALLEDARGNAAISPRVVVVKR